MKRPISIIIALLTAVCTMAQTADTIRYVSEEKGKYTNDGKSWATAKNNIQEAINDLHEYLSRTDNPYTSGSVYVAKGTYTPTESTEATDAGTLYASFKIYDGISLYGGFEGSELSPSERKIKTMAGDEIEIADIDDNTSKNPLRWRMVNETTLSGNLSSSSNTPLTWNADKATYTAAYLGNSYHVVWFATRGFYEDDYSGSDETSVANKGKLRARPLNVAALVDGFSIVYGNASSKETSKRQHNSYGGGVYMVGNSYLRNCRVYQNSASRRGGGVYMDGGGNVDACMVYENQCAGVGVLDGYGGGVCIDYDGVVKHSLMMRNEARIGGGLAICHEKDDYLQPCKTESDTYFVNRYHPTASGCVVSNNTSSTEAGGVFLDEGGTVNHITIVRNKCEGQDVVSGNRRYGRTGGLYVNESAIVFNAVGWGNHRLTTTSTKDKQDKTDVQYAAYCTSTTYIPYVYFSAFSQNELTDWSGSQKISVYSLESGNESENGAEGLYPQFKSPSSTAGVYENSSEIESSNWTPMSTTDLRGKGIKMNDYSEDSEIIGALIDEDIWGKAFAQRCILGAICPEDPSYRFSMLAPVDGSSTTEKIPTLFVDPSRDETNAIDNAKAIGSSWDSPIYLLNDALSFIEHLRTDAATTEEKTALNGTEAINFTSTTPCQILVKEGENINMGNYRDGTLRSSRIQMVSNVSVYGGYYSKLKDTDIDQVTSTDGTTIKVARNPKAYPTRITANVSADNYKRMPTT